MTNLDVCLLNTIAQEEITFKDSDGRDKTVLLNAATKKFILNEEEPNDDKRIMCEATRYPNRSTDTDSPSGSFNIYSYGNVLVNQASDAAVNPQNSQTDDILRCTILNKMSGTATFEVTKVWKDNNNVLDLRGDIFLNLFQSKVENGIVNSEVSRVNQEYNAVRQLVEYNLYDKSTEKTYHVSLTQDERDSLKYTVKLTDASATPAVVYNGEITIPPKTADMKVAFANELYLINLQSNNGTFFTVPAPSNLSIRDIHNYTFYYEPKGDILHFSFSKAERKTAQNPDANTTPVNYSVTLTERVSAEPNASKWYDVVMTHKETQISVGVSSVITTTYSGSMRMSETRDEDDYVGAFLDWFGNVYEEQDKGDGTKEIVIRDGTNGTENHLLLENGKTDQDGTYTNAFGYELFTYTQNNNEMTSSRIAPVDYSRFSYEMELVTRETTVKTTAVFTQDNTDNNKYVAVVTIPNGDGSNDKATYSITLENVTGDLGQALVNAINGPGQLHHTTTGEAFPKNLYQAYRCITTENQTPGVSIYRFESLPRFDNDGYEIAYFANETYIKRGDYAAPYYELPDESDLRPKYFAYGDEPQKNKAKSDKYLANYAYNNSTIVNRLEDVITAKGSKRWKNIRVTLDKGYYPTAFFALYVKDPYKTYEDSAETHDGTATGFKITDAKLGELVYKTQTSTDEQGNTVETKIYNVQRVDPGNLTYNFGSDLPKYNSEGALLTYNIKEQHIEAYTNNIQQDKSLPSLIVNTYNSTETMDFEIKKDWKNIDLDLYYPTVVIYLSQKIKISKGETIFKNGRQQAADKDIYETYYNYPAVILRKGYDSAEFKNLPKTDPRGNDFIYTVKEVMRLYNGEEIENELMDEDGHPRPSSSQDEEIPEANGYRMKIDVEDLPSVQEYVLTGKDGNNNTVKYYATFNLTDGSGYHYQVVFKDNNGNIVTVPDNIEAPDAFADLGSLLQGKTISVGGRNITINNTFTSQKLNSAVKRYVLTNHQEARQADGTIVDEGKKYVVTFKGVPETQGMYDIDLTDGTTHYTYMEQTEGSSTYVRKAYLFEDDPSDLGDALIRDHLTLRVVTAVTEPTPETNNGCLVGFTSAEAEVLEYELTDNKSTPDDPTDDKVYHALFVQDPNELNVYYAEITDGNGISYTGTITTEKGLEDLDLGEWCVLNNANIGGLSINRDTFTSKLLTDSHITRTPRITNTYSPDVNNFQTEINVDKEWTTNDGVTLGAEYGSLYNRKLQYVLQRRTARLETKNLFSLLVGGQTIQFYEDEAKRIPAENTTDYYDIVYDEPQIVVSDYFPEGADTTLEENKVIPVDQNFGIYVKKTKTNENDPDEYLDLRSSSTDESYYKFTKRQSGEDLRGNSITAASSVYRKVIYFQDVHYDELTETTSENLIPVIITIDLTEPGNYLTRIQHLAAYGQDGSLYTYKVVEDPSDLFEQYDKKEADEEETIDKSEEEIHTPNTQECSADWQANLYLFNKLITAKIGIVKTFGAELPDGTVAKLPKEDYEQFFDDGYFKNLSFKIIGESDTGLFNIVRTIKGTSLIAESVAKTPLYHSEDGGAYYYFTVDDEQKRNDYLPLKDPVGALYRYYVTEVNSGTPAAYTDRYGEITTYVGFSEEDFGTTTTTTDGTGTEVKTFTPEFPVSDTAKHPTVDVYDTTNSSSVRFTALASDTYSCKVNNNNSDVFDIKLADPNTIVTVDKNKKVTLKYKAAIPDGTAVKYTLNGTEYTLNAEHSVVSEPQTGDTFKYSYTVTTTGATPTTTTSEDYRLPVHNNTAMKITPSGAAAALTFELLLTNYDSNGIVHAGSVFTLTSTTNEAVTSEGKNLLKHADLQSQIPVIKGTTTPATKIVSFANLDAGTYTYKVNDDTAGHQIVISGTDPYDTVVTLDNGTLTLKPSKLPTGTTLTYQVNGTTSGQITALTGSATFTNVTANSISYTVTAETTVPPIEEGAESTATTTTDTVSVTIEQVQDVTVSIMPRTTVPTAESTEGGEETTDTPQTTYTISFGKKTSSEEGQEATIDPLNVYETAEFVLSKQGEAEYEYLFDPAGNNTVFFYNVFKAKKVDLNKYWEDKGKIKKDDGTFEELYNADGMRPEMLEVFVTESFEGVTDSTTGETVTPETKYIPKLLTNKEGWSKKGVYVPRVAFYSDAAYNVSKIELTEDLNADIDYASKSSTVTYYDKFTELKELYGYNETDDPLNADTTKNGVIKTLDNVARYEHDTLDNAGYYEIEHNTLNLNGENDSSSLRSQADYVYFRDNSYYTNTNGESGPIPSVEAWGKVYVTYYDNSNRPLDGYVGIDLKDKFKDKGDDVYRIDPPENAVKAVFSNGTQKTEMIAFARGHEYSKIFDWNNTNGKLTVETYNPVDHNALYFMDNPVTVTVGENTVNIPEWDTVKVVFYDKDKKPITVTKEETVKDAAGTETTQQVTSVISESAWAGVRLSADHVDDYGNAVYKVVPPEGAAYVLFNDGMNTFQTVLLKIGDDIIPGVTYRKQSGSMAEPNKTYSTTYHSLNSDMLYFRDVKVSDQEDMWGDVEAVFVKKELEENKYVTVGDLIVKQAESKDALTETYRFTVPADVTHVSFRKASDHSAHTPDMLISGYFRTNRGAYRNGWVSTASTEEENNGWNVSTFDPIKSYVYFKSPEALTDANSITYVFRFFNRTVGEDGNTSLSSEESTAVLKGSEYLDYMDALGNYVYKYPVPSNTYEIKFRPTDKPDEDAYYMKNVDAGYIYTITGKGEIPITPASEQLFFTNDQYSFDNGQYQTSVSKWDNVYAYFFRYESGQEIPVGESWPGRKITNNDLAYTTSGIHTYRLTPPNGSTYVIFNNGSANTDDPDTVYERTTAIAIRNGRVYSRRSVFVPNANYIEQVANENNGWTVTFDQLPVWLNPTGTEDKYGESSAVEYFVVEEVPDIGTTGYIYTDQNQNPVYVPFKSLKPNDTILYPYVPEENTIDPNNDNFLGASNAVKLIDTVPYSIHGSMTASDDYLEMDKIAEHVYRGIFTVASGTHTFKIYQDQSASTCWGDNVSDISLTTTGKATTVYVLFDEETKQITASYKTFGDDSADSSLTNKLYNYTAPTPADSIYNVVYHKDNDSSNTTVPLKTIYNGFYRAEFKLNPNVESDKAVPTTFKFHVKGTGADDNWGLYSENAEITNSGKTKYEASKITEKECQLIIEKETTVYVIFNTTSENENCYPVCYFYKQGGDESVVDDYILATGNSLKPEPDLGIKQIVGYMNSPKLTDRSFNLENAEMHYKDYPDAQTPVDRKMEFRNTLRIRDIIVDKQWDDQGVDEAEGDTHYDLSITLRNDQLQVRNGASTSPYSETKKIKKDGVNYVIFKDLPVYGNKKAGAALTPYEYKVMEQIAGEETAEQTDKAHASNGYIYLTDQDQSAPFAAARFINRRVIGSKTQDTVVKTVSLSDADVTETGINPYAAQLYRIAVDSTNEDYRAATHVQFVSGDKKTPLYRLGTDIKNGNMLVPNDAVYNEPKNGIYSVNVVSSGLSDSDNGKDYFYFEDIAYQSDLSDQWGSAITAVFYTRKAEGENRFEFTDTVKDVPVTVTQDNSASVYSKIYRIKIPENANYVVFKYENNTETEPILFAENTNYTRTNEQKTVNGVKKYQVAVSTFNDAAESVTVLRFVDLNSAWGTVKAVIGSETKTADSSFRDSQGNTVYDFKVTGSVSNLKVKFIGNTAAQTTDEMPAATAMELRGGVTKDGMFIPNPDVMFFTYPTAWTDGAAVDFYSAVRLDANDHYEYHTVSVADNYSGNYYKRDTLIHYIYIPEGATHFRIRNANDKWQTTDYIEINSEILAGQVVDGTESSASSYVLIKDGAEIKHDGIDLSSVTPVADNIRYIAFDQDSIHDGNVLSAILTKGEETQEVVLADCGTDNSEHKIYSLTIPDGMMGASVQFVVYASAEDNTTPIMQTDVWMLTSQEDDDTPYLKSNTLYEVSKIPTVQETNSGSETVSETVYEISDSEKSFAYKTPYAHQLSSPIEGKLYFATEWTAPTAHFFKKDVVGNVRTDTEIEKVDLTDTRSTDSNGNKIYSVKIPEGAAYVVYESGDGKKKTEDQQIGINVSVNEIYAMDAKTKTLYPTNTSVQTDDPFIYLDSYDTSLLSVKAVYYDNSDRELKADTDSTPQMNEDGTVEFTFLPPSNAQKVKFVYNGAVEKKKPITFIRETVYYADLAGVTNVEVTTQSTYETFDMSTERVFHQHDKYYGYEASCKAKLEGNYVVRYTITNKLPVLNFETVVKWNDDQNRDGLRPYRVNVELKRKVYNNDTSDYRADSETIRTVPVTEAQGVASLNGWLTTSDSVHKLGVHLVYNKENQPFVYNSTEEGEFTKTYTAKTINVDNNIGYLGVIGDTLNKEGIPEIENNAIKTQNAPILLYDDDNDGIWETRSLSAGEVADTKIILSKRTANELDAATGENLNTRFEGIEWTVPENQCGASECVTRLDTTTSTDYHNWTASIETPPATGTIDYLAAKNYGAEYSQPFKADTRTNTAVDDRLVAADISVFPNSISYQYPNTTFAGSTSSGARAALAEGTSAANSSVGKVTFNIVNSYAPPVQDIEVKKKWENEKVTDSQGNEINYAEKTRPDKVEFELSYKFGSGSKTKISNSADDQKYLGTTAAAYNATPLKHLPLDNANYYDTFEFTTMTNETVGYDDLYKNVNPGGTEIWNGVSYPITYYVDEVRDDYLSTAYTMENDKESGFTLGEDIETVTITNSLVTKKITVNKTWDDGEYAQNRGSTHYDVKAEVILKDDTSVKQTLLIPDDTATVTTGNGGGDNTGNTNNSGTQAPKNVAIVPLYIKNGNTAKLAEYTVKETTYHYGYVGSYDQKDDEKVEGVSAERKDFIGSDSSAATPVGIDLINFSHEEKEDPNDQNSETVTVHDLEVTIKNTLPLIYLKVEKTWDDDNNRDGLRPESIKFTLTRTPAQSTKDIDKVTLADKPATPEAGHEYKTITINPSISDKFDTATASVSSQWRADICQQSVESRFRLPSLKGL